MERYCTFWCVESWNEGDKLKQRISHADSLVPIHANLQFCMGRQTQLGLLYYMFCLDILHVCLSRTLQYLQQNLLQSDGPTLVLNSSRSLIHVFWTCRFRISTRGGLLEKADYPGQFRNRDFSFRTFEPFVMPVCKIPHCNASMHNAAT